LPFVLEDGQGNSCTMQFKLHLLRLIQNFKIDFSYNNMWLFISVIYKVNISIIRSNALNIPAGLGRFCMVITQFFNFSITEEFS